MSYSVEQEASSARLQHQASDGQHFIEGLGGKGY